MIYPKGGTVAREERSVKPKHVKRPRLSGVANRVSREGSAGGERSPRAAFLDPRPAHGQDRRLVARPPVRRRARIEERSHARRPRRPGRRPVRRPRRSVSARRRAREEREEREEEVGRECAAGRGGNGEPRRAHGDVDERRREPRREDARLRPARRPVHAARRGWRGEGAHALARVGHAAALLAGREADRVRERRGRRRQRLGDERRRDEGAGGLDGGLPPRQQPRLAPVRRLRRRAQALQRDAQPRLGRDLALPRERGRASPSTRSRTGRRTSASRRSPPTAGTSTSRRTRPPAGTFEYNKNSHDQIYVVQRLDTTEGDRDVRDGAGRRRAAGSLAGRPAPRLRAARRQPVDALRQGSRDRRGAPGVGRARS